ncbi:uncharacterized protein LOC120426894 [Culex pipiens pallens]|uniref:uncharacterized protein LOC120426894 n=1 Tax=Culex pipiens pallens TaxID=42434 RepID=UPI0022AAA824|nr:uncharacterized protein LOC120426894 [Culex pipiens pallens]
MVGPGTLFFSSTGIFLHIWKNPPHYDTYKLLIDKRQLLTYLEAAANELKKIVALPCYNLTPSPSPPPSLCSPSSPTPSSKRFRWSLDLNRDLMFCYYVVTGGGQNTIGYRSRLQDLWCSRQTSYGHLTEQNLLSQLRRIQRDHLLPEDVLRKVRTEANEYEFDYHCSRSRPLKISDKNRKVFRKMAKNYSRMKELHSINRALSYVNSVVDMKFCASREIDVLAMKRVVQVLGETIRSSRDMPNIGRHLTSFLSILIPRYFLSDTKVRHYLSHCRRDFSSLLETMDEEVDYAELHRNLKILRNLLLYIQNLGYILAIKTLMNRLYDSKCLEEIKSYYAYIFRNNSTDLLKDLEFAPFLLLEIDTIIDSIAQHLPTTKLSDRFEKIKLSIRKEIDSYKSLHNHFTNAILLFDCIVSKIKSNHNHDKIKHLFRSHLRVFQLDRKINTLFLNRLKSNLLTFLHEDLPSINDDQIESRIILLVTRIQHAIDTHQTNLPKPATDNSRISFFPSVDDITDLINRLEKRTGRSLTTLAQDPLFQKAKDYPEKRYDLLRQCLQKHKIAIDSIILQDLKQEDQKLIDAKISQMQALFMDQNMNLRAFDRTEEIAFEMLMLEATWALSSKLLNNAESISGYVPVLTGRNMRNYLAHGGLTYEVLIPNTSSKTILQNALSVMKLSKNIISEIYERHSWSFADRLECLQRQSDTLEGFRIQSCVEILDTIKAEQYLIGQDHLHRGVVDRLVQTQSCLLLGHLLDLRNVDELLKILSHLMEDVKVIPCNVKFHDLLTNLTARIRFCFNLALLTNEEDVLLKIASDFGYDQIEAIPMIFTFDKLFTSFLENHPDYDVNTESNAEVLHYAVLSGNVELLNLLLDQCEDLNQQDAYSQTPLDVACKLSNVDMIKSLTNAGAKWYSKNASQYTWLFLNNDHEAIIFLKNNDLLDEKIAKSCINLFLQYCEDDKEEMVEFMLNYVEYTSLYPLAARHRRLHALNYMIANDPRVKTNINRKDSFGQTALQISCHRGYREIAVLLLNHSGNPNLQDVAGNTCLHLAIENGDTKIVRLLLKHHVKVETKNLLGKTSLDLAVELGNLSIVRMLLKHKRSLKAVQIPECLHSLEIMYLLKKANLQYKLEAEDCLTPLHIASDEGRIRVLLNFFEVDTQTSKYLDTPLHIACLTNQTDAVRVLLKYGANHNLLNSNGLSPLHFAVINQNTDMVRMLTCHSNLLDPRHVNSAMTISIQKGYLEIADILLNCGADISLIAESIAPQQYLLHAAARSGFVSILRYLLQGHTLNVNGPDSTGSTPLFHAVTSADIQTVELLLQHGADVEHTNKSGQNVISTAAMFDRLDIIRYLINNFPNITPFILAPYVAQNRCLHIAVLKGSLEMVHYFIKLHKDNNFHLNHRNQEGFTALHISAQTGSVRIFQLLLDSGADPSIPLTNKQSILHTAVSNNNLAIARILLTRALIDVNALDDDRRTILHYSVYSRNPSAVRELLKIRGLHINGQDRLGNSALHLAAEHQYVDIYNLLQKRIDNSLMNQDGKRAIDILLRK